MAQRQPFLAQWREWIEADEVFAIVDMFFLYLLQIAIADSHLDGQLDLWQQDIHRRALIQAHSQDLFHVDILFSVQYQIVHVLLDQRRQTTLME